MSTRVSLRPKAETEIPPAQRIASSTKHLASLAADIKAAGNELRASISPLEAALEKFSLGVSAWFEITGNSHEDGTYWHRSIGYAQVGAKWGIALRRVSGHQLADHENVEIWLFGDAPSWMQIESITKIPDLLEALSKRVEDTITKLREKASQADEFTTALNAALAEHETTPEW